MVFYSWRKMYRKSGGSSKRIILILRSMIQQNMPQGLYDPIYKYYYDDFSGESFLLNPHNLFYNEFRYRPKEIAQYIGLASFRNYANYCATRDATLDLLHSPVSEDTIKSNRLLNIVGDRIHFAYEKS